MDALGVDQPGPLPDGFVVDSTSVLDGDILIFDSLGAPYEGTGLGTPLDGNGAGGMEHIIVREVKGGKTGEVTVSPRVGRVDAAW